MKTMICNSEPKRLHGISQTLRWGRALLAMALVSAASVFDAGAQTTIFSENFGTPAGTTSFGNYTLGTAPATFQNKGNLTFSQGDATNPGDVRSSSNSTGYLGASGGGNVFFSSCSTLGTYGLGIQNINASAYNTLQLSYGYRKELASASATLSVDYWNGTSWTLIANQSSALFNETANATTGWYLAKTLSLPVGAQIDGLKIRFVKSGSNSIRLDDIKLTGTINPSSDTTPPSISALVPTNSATRVSISDNLVASFSEPVQAGTGAIELKKSSDGSTIPATITISGSTLTVDPTGDLNYSTSYYVLVPAGAVKDSAGNSFGGILTTTAWAFTTDSPDTTAPTVVTYSPLGSNAVPTSSLRLTFSEAISPIGGNVTLKKVGGAVVETIVADYFTPGFVVDNSTVTIPLTAALDYGTTYYVQIAGDAFEDSSGNRYVGIPSSDTTTWTFTTVDVPALTSTPYTQTFSSYVSAATLPQGWSASGPAAYLSAYVGNWGSVSDGGFRGNASVFGYHHTSLTLTNNAPLNQILTLRNTTGAEINDLTVAYKGRMTLPENTRIPVFTVTVGGVTVNALGYSTADRDNAQRNASIGGLSIPNGSTFQIVWASSYPSGFGSARQIGISDVSVSVGNSVFAPTATTLNVPVATIGSLSATVRAEIVSTGGQTLTGSGFVYAATAVNAAPQLGGSGVSMVEVGSPDVGAFSSTLTGLTPGTNYSVCAYATNASGTSYTGVGTFTTLATYPSFTGNYTQAFNGITGNSTAGITNMPAGWTALSDASPPLQVYAGSWGQSATTGGFLGSNSTGVLGYRHTTSSGNLTVTLHLINATGGVLTSLDVSYLGRVERTTEGRSPVWTVAVNGGAAVEALAYDTLGKVDAVKSTKVTGLSIGAGNEFTITWISDRGLRSPEQGSSKQIGIGEVAISAVPTGNSYATWAATNAGGQASGLDYDGDGVSNGVEYFMGATGSSMTTTPQVVGGKITYPKSATATNAAGTIETSSDLVTWQPVTADSSVAGFISYTLPTGRGKIFARLKVVVTP